MRTIRTPDPLWKTTGPKASWDEFDPIALATSSFGLSPWAGTAGTGVTIADCEVEADPSLHTASQLAADVATVQVKAADAQTLMAGAKLWFRLCMTLSDGQRDDRTFWRLVWER